MLQFPPVPPVHRNMPKDQAMDFVATEYSRRRVKERPLKDPADSAAKASQLLDDFLEREKIERHAVPSETRQLLLLLADGVHLYPEEMESISEYVRSRQDHTRGTLESWDRCRVIVLLAAPLTSYLFVVLDSYFVVCSLILDFSVSSIQHRGTEREHVTSRIGETTSSAPHATRAPSTPVWRRSRWVLDGPPPPAGSSPVFTRSVDRLLFFSLKNSRVSEP